MSDITADFDGITVDSTFLTADGFLTTSFKAMAKQNLGKSKNSDLPKYIRRIIVTPDDFRLEAADMATPAAFKSAIEALIKAGINDRGYIYPDLFRVEPLSTEAVYEETPLSVRDVDDGQYRWKLHIAKDMFTHKALHTHKYIEEGRVIIQDLDNQVLIAKDSAGKGMGFSIAILKAEKMMMSDATNSSTTPIYLALNDNEEWDLSGHVLDKTFGSVIKQIFPLTDVEIVLADGDAFAAAGFMVDVRQLSDGTPVSGLLPADFLMRENDGITAQVINTAAEDANVPGRYNLLPPNGGGDNFVDGTLRLRAASAMTAGVGPYECPTPLVVNIP